MMHAHRIIGRDRSVLERPFLLALILRNIFGKNTLIIPEFLDVVLELRKIKLFRDFLENHVCIIARFVLLSTQGGAV